MHPTALYNCDSFFKTYSPSFPTNFRPRILEIGSQDVNGSLRSLAPPQSDYLGVDFVAGRGVDLVLSDPYKLPFEDMSFDIALSSSCFEHSEMYWLVFLEVMRVLRPRGLFYLNAPSNGLFHRYPLDCWRFYPDSGRALVTWARRNGIQAELLESYISTQVGGIWNDFVAVFVRDERHISDFPQRILHTKTDVMNGVMHGHNEFVRPSTMSEDQYKLSTISKIISNEIKVI